MPALYFYIDLLKSLVSILKIEERGIRFSHGEYMRPTIRSAL